MPLSKKRITALEMYMYSETCHVTKHLFRRFSFLVSSWIGFYTFSETPFCSVKNTKQRRCLFLLIISCRLQFLQQVGFSQLLVTRRGEHWTKESSYRCCRPVSTGRSQETSISGKFTIRWWYPNWWHIVLHSWWCKNCICEERTQKALHFYFLLYAWVWIMIECL